MTEQERQAAYDRSSEWIYLTLTYWQMKPTLSGFAYLRDCALLVAEDPGLIYRTMKFLYPAVAEKNGVSEVSVETSIRRAIRQAWADPSGRMRQSFRAYHAGVEKRPSNTETISALAHIARLKNNENLRVGEEKMMPLDMWYELWYNSTGIQPGGHH